MAGEKRNHKKRFAFNVVDLMIAVAVLLLVLWGIMRYDKYNKEKAAAEKDLATAVVLIENADEELFGAISEGDGVFFDENGEKSGKVVEKALRNTTGKDVLVTVDISGEMTKNGFMLAGERYIAAGTETVFGSDKYVTNVKIVDIKLKNS